MYATANDLKEYMGRDVADAERLLLQAEAIVDEVTVGRVDMDNPVLAKAAKNATCAQVEYWVTMGGDQVDIMGSPDGFSVGTFQMSGKLPVLAPRARRFLFSAGLLYRGLRQARGAGNLADGFFANVYNSGGPR